MTADEFMAEALRRLGSIDERLTRLESLTEKHVTSTVYATGVDIDDVRRSVDHLGDMLEQDKRERDLATIRFDLRAAGKAG